MEVRYDQLTGTVHYLVHRGEGCGKGGAFRLLNLI